MEETESDVLTSDERKLAGRMLRTFYAFSLVLNVVVFCAVAYAGYLGWVWQMVIPVGATSMFAARVLKKYLRNIVDRLVVESALNEEGNARPDMQRHRESRLTPKLVMLVGVTMVIVAALWYLIGVGLRWALAG